VLAEIQQHVDQAASGLARGGEGAGVIAVLPDGAAPARDAVDSARASDGEALKAANQPLAIVRLHHQVQMVRLHGEVNQSEPAARARRERVAQRQGLRSRAQRRKTGTRAQGRVHRMPLVVPRPGRVRDAGARPFGRASGAGAPATPGAGRW
jgi:hypothetical protein